MPKIHNQMFHEVRKDEWLAALEMLDFGISCGASIFARMQDWLRKALKESDFKASHSFMVKYPPFVSEANGWTVNHKKSIERYFTDHHKVYILRSAELDEMKSSRMMDFSDGVEEGGAVYAWGGILQFPKRLAAKWFGWKVKIKDCRGMFCSEYTSRLIQRVKLYYTKRLAHTVTPSFQLHWFLTEGISSNKWKLVAFYDRGKFYLSD